MILPPSRPKCPACNGYGSRILPAPSHALSDALRLPRLRGPRRHDCTDCGGTGNAPAADATTTNAA